MNKVAMIVSAISVIACLLLAMRSSTLQDLGAARIARLALVWAAIILGLAVVIRLTGLQIAP